MAEDARGTPMPSDLSADRPGDDPNSDRLGYAPFAKRLALGISRLSRAVGQVVALYGGWGFGKTTMLNYVRHFLNGMGPSEQPIIVSYNPWWFSGHEDLVRAFFGQLRAKLENQREFPSEVRTRLADFAEALSDVPLPYFNWGKLVGRAIRPSPKDIERLKGDIAAALRAQPRRILVMIDDIDRLTSEEIRQVFRAVKSVGDFPNVTYLMAFDKRVVARSLGELQGGSGEDYLEKIVQIPFELPLVDRMAIRGLFFEKADVILAGIDPKSFDQTYWGNMFFEGIDKFLETPRDVVRFTNVLAVTLRAVIGEVNPVDFIAVESLRMFCPEVYDTIKNNHEMFSGHAPDNVLRPTREELNEFHALWCARLNESNPTQERPVRAIVQRLFPKLGAVWGNTHFGPESEAEWRRERRVCSSSVFPVYFSLAVPLGEISNSEMRGILADTENPEHFSSDLLRFAKEIRADGKTRASALLDRLQDYTAHEIPPERIGPIVSVLLDVGDELTLPEDKAPGFLDLGNDAQMSRIIWQLLKRLELAERFELLRRAFETGRAVYMIQHVLIVLGQQQGLYGGSAHPEQEWFVTREQLQALEGILLTKIRRAGQDGSLLRTPNLLHVLNFWREKGGHGEVRAWVADTVKDDRRLAEFLERFLSSSSSFQLGDAVGRRRDRLDPNWLTPYLDVEQIVDRVRKLGENVPLSDRQRRAVIRFLKEYEFRKRGGNPDDPFAQDRIT